MNRFNALDVGAAISSVHALRCRCDSLEAANGMGVPADADLLDDVNRVLSQVSGIAREDKFERCADVVATAKHNLKTDNNITTIKAHLAHVEDAVLSDLGDRQFLRVARHRASFVDNDTLFGPGVNTAFPSATRDIRDAGNCLSADCNTAAVFHLMRAVEWALRAFCVDLGYKTLRCTNKKTGKVTYKPLEFSEWETILSQIKSRASEKYKTLTRGRKKQALQEFYLPAIQDFEGFRDAFRNHVMHTRREYTGPEADAIRDRVERFMRLLATRISEV